LSTLTKTLIVLLTVFSVFLCGLVVTYVANVDNYKQKYDTLYNNFRAAKENEKDAQRQLREKIEETDRQKEQLNGEISSLTMTVGELEAKLDKLIRENAMLLQKVSSMASLVEAANQTAQQQTKLFEDAEKELSGVRTEQIKQRNELKETTDALIEKIAIISTLQEKNKQMLEEKTELQTKLDQLLRQYGRVIAPPTPVTPRREIARPVPAAMPVTKDIGLKGLVTAVDLENSLAEISIGTADGVRNEMKFHVTRGDKFICDILILDVDSDRAVGILELVQQPPRVGDSVSTNL